MPWQPQSGRSSGRGELHTLWHIKYETLNELSKTSRTWLMQMYGLKITAAAARTLQAAVVTHHLRRYNSHPYRDTASKPMVETAAVHYRPSCKVPSKTTGWKSQQGLQMGSSKFRETRSQDSPAHTLWKLAWYLLFSAARRLALKERQLHLGGEDSARLQQQQSGGVSVILHAGPN